MEIPDIKDADPQSAKMGKLFSKTPSPNCEMKSVSVPRAAPLCLTLLALMACGGGGNANTGIGGLPLAPSSQGSSIRITIRTSGSGTSQVSATLTLENQTVTSQAVVNNSFNTDSFVFDGVQEGSHTVTGQMAAANMKIDLTTIPKNGTSPAGVVGPGSVQNLEGPAPTVIETNSCTITYGLITAPIPSPPYSAQLYRFQFQVIPFNKMATLCSSSN
jgi:hypothetical protein